MFLAMEKLTLRWRPTALEDEDRADLQTELFQVRQAGHLLTRDLLQIYLGPKVAAICAATPPSGKTSSCVGTWTGRFSDQSTSISPTSPLSECLLPPLVRASR